MSDIEKKFKGRLFEGSVERGVRIILDEDESIEEYPVGALIKIRGKMNDFLGLITNVEIKSYTEGIDLIARRDVSDEIKELLWKANPNALRLQIVEAALISKMNREDGEFSRADVVPDYNSPLEVLTDEDIKLFYGVETEQYLLGYPKTAQKIKVGIPINMDKLVDLSFAIYGKSGSGKTFLGNIIAGYIVTYDRTKSIKAKEQGEVFDKGVKLLIFDMHSEYGLELRDNRGNPISPGVGQIFKDLFHVYTPDLELAKKRNLKPLYLNVKEIQPEDIFLIAPIFNLSSTFVSHIYTFKRILSDDLGLDDLWFLAMFDGKQLKSQLEGTEEGREILRELKSRIKNRFKLEDIREEAQSLIKSREGYQLANSFGSQTSKLRRILNYPMSIRDDTILNIVDTVLTEDAGNVIISMGRFEKEMPLYMILANLIARKLRKRIFEMEEAGEEIRNKVIIFIEEAHNFLGKTTYNYSPFGDIAREMRKKGVTLCIIDQKPGELDPNAVSMVWTSFVFSLTDKRDIDQAILGVDKADLFKKIVPTLSPREVLAFGEAVRYPAVVEVVDYKEAVEKFKSIEEDIRKMVEEAEDDLREGGFI